LKEEILSTGKGNIITARTPKGIVAFGK